MEYDPEDHKLPKHAAAFVGRFQPFHLGHARVVKQMAGLFDELIVVIGSAEQSYTRANPFTSGERHVMVRDYARSEHLDNVTIVPIADTTNNAAWVANLTQHCPPFQYVIGNNAGVHVHFEGHHNRYGKPYQVMRPEHWMREMYVGTKIRALLLEDPSEARTRLPETTWDVIEGCAGVARVRGLNGFEAGKPAMD
jgi:nicotinamide-nucleotide adenylyltransferase